MSSASASPSTGTRLLLETLRSAGSWSTLRPADWDLVLPSAERARLSARLAAEVGETGRRALPAFAADRLQSARIRGQEFERVITWEIDRVHRALRATGIRVVFLKGAGYLAAGLPIAVGRAVADVDVLVDRREIERAEAALVAHGWRMVELSAYDERYYRRWMHELPPLRHHIRGTVLDVHHAILPKTSRIVPDSSVLLSRAVDHSGTFTLCATHMVLHAAAHLFHDGEIGGALRDVVDLDGLLRTYADTVPDFWSQLAADAGGLGLGRPTFYAVRYAERLMLTPVPASFWHSVRSDRPGAPLLSLMDALVTTTLGDEGRVADLTTMALYVRSHWLRMPPLMLARHLLHQAVAR